MPATLPTLSYKETALLTGEAEEPTWKSPNELLHERINFDDTIWGFGLAGGAYYQTPLRVTYVRPGSRAEKANVYPGDVVLKINGVDSSQLTLEQAHDLIIQSGINLMLNVTAPEDEEESYFVYEDPLVEDEPEEVKPKKKLFELPTIPKPEGKCSHWSLQWPWKCKRKLLYKESNCYMVPSKFEETHKDTRKPEVKEEDIILESIYDLKQRAKEAKAAENSKDVNDNTQHNNETEPSDAVDNNSFEEAEPEIPVISSRADKLRRKISVERSVSRDAETEDIDAEDTSSLGSEDENNNKDTKFNRTVNPKTTEEIELSSSTGNTNTQESAPTDILGTKDKKDTDEPVDSEDPRDSLDKQINDDTLPNGTVDLNDTEKTEINGSLDSIKINKDMVLNGFIDKDSSDGATSEDFANFDKFENEDIPGMSKSEKLITNGR